MQDMTWQQALIVVVVVAGVLPWVLGEVYAVIAMRRRRARREAYRRYCAALDREERNGHG